MTPLKFQIYLPTSPDHHMRDLNVPILPWVFDQDRSSGREASMWVTPVDTLPDLGLFRLIRGVRGVRVEGTTVVISVKDNDAARELCGALIEEMSK